MYFVNTKEEEVFNIFIDKYCFFVWNYLVPTSFLSVEVFNWLLL